MNGLEVLARHKWGVSKGEDGLADRLLQLCLPNRVLGWRESSMCPDGVRLGSKGAGCRGEALDRRALPGQLHDKLDRWFPLILGGLLCYRSGSHRWLGRRGLE
jgi:hypothetical protein